MNLAPLLSIGLIALLLPVKAATVNFRSGTGGVESLVLFESVDGTSLSGGYLFAGRYASPPGPGASQSDLLNNFVLFAPLGSNPSNSAGLFNDSDFVAPLGAFTSEKLYLLVANDSDIFAATEFAVFSSSSTAWSFPSSEIDPSITIQLPLADEFLAGSADMINLSGTDFNTVKLEAVGPPDPPVVPQIKHVIVGGQPGIEFEFPTADAGTVNWVLQESTGDTLMEVDWTDVVASPSVVNDTGTIQTIQILHPDMVSSDNEKFFRLQGTSL